MDAEELKSRLGRNIAAYRKQENWTQAGLAERLNYSDKAVSKWERGESLPDVMTLIQLAGVFGVFNPGNQQRPDGSGDHHARRKSQKDTLHPAGRLSAHKKDVAGTESRDTKGKQGGQQRHFYSIHKIHPKRQVSLPVYAVGEDW